MLSIVRNCTLLKECWFILTKSTKRRRDVRSIWIWNIVPPELSWTQKSQKFVLVGTAKSILCTIHLLNMYICRLYQEKMHQRLTCIFTKLVLVGTAKNIFWTIHLLNMYVHIFADCTRKKVHHRLTWFSKKFALHLTKSKKDLLWDKKCGTQWKIECFSKRPPH